MLVILHGAGCGLPHPTGSPDHGHLSVLVADARNSSDSDVSKKWCNLWSKRRKNQPFWSTKKLEQMLEKLREMGSAGLMSANPLQQLVKSSEKFKAKKVTKQIASRCGCPKRWVVLRRVQIHRNDQPGMVSLAWSPAETA